MSILLTGLNKLAAISILSAGLIIITTHSYADEYAYKPSLKNTDTTLKKGEKWATDATLRLDMDNIRLAFATNQDDILKERLRAQDYQYLAQVIDQNIADIVKNCKLTQGADKALHIVVITDLVDSAKLMRTASNIQAQRVGALGALQTLRNYGKYFQHPDWNMDVVNKH